MLLHHHLRALELDPRRLLSTGKVFLDGIPTGDGGREVDPSRVTVRPDAPRLSPGRDPAVIYKDDHLVVVWKPPGMLAVPAAGRRERNVLGFVARLFGEAHAVHRIDEGTSGLLMVARTTAAQTALKDLLERHDVERRYLALVRGHLPPGERTMHTTFVRDRGDGLRGSGDGPDSREAITQLTTVETLDRCTLVEARLTTGRTHQVRIHLAESGHPILGDPLYGDGRGAPRLALHAAVLGFRHPFTRSPVRWQAPLADDLERLRRDKVRSR